MIRLIIISLLISVASFAKVRGEVGNGSGSIICLKPSGEIRKVRLLDYYVGETLMPDLKRELTGKDAYEMVASALARTQPVDRDRAERYFKHLKEFKDEMQMLTNMHLPSTQDWGLVPLENGCRIEQLAIQRKPIFPSEKRYLINQDLWNQLPDEDRAGLILHEIIYREAIELGHKDSIKTRYLNIFLSSSEMNLISKSNYDNRVKGLGFNTQEPSNGIFWLMNPVILPKAEQNTAYSHGVANFVKSSNPLTFSKLSGPSWLTVDSNGWVRGTPNGGNVGPNSIGVRAMDNEGLYADVTVSVYVEVSGTELKWNQDPILLGTQYTGGTCDYHLRDYLNDPTADGAELSFSKVPFFIQAFGNGKIIVDTTSPDSIGNWKFTVCANSKVRRYEGVCAEVNLKVEKQSGGDTVQWISDNITLPNASEDMAYSITLNQYISNPGGGTLTFRMVTNSPWLQVNSVGTVYGTPRKVDIGLHSFTVQVSNGVQFATAKFSLTVVHTNKPPVWIQNPIKVNCSVGEYMRVNLQELTADVDGDPIAFTENGVPIPNGILKRMFSNPGDYSTRVTASDGQMMTHVDVQFHVTSE